MKKLMIAILMAGLVNQGVCASDAQATTAEQVPEAEKKAKEAYAANPDLYKGIINALVASKDVARKDVATLITDVVQTFRSQLSDEQKAVVKQVIDLGIQGLDMFVTANTPGKAGYAQTQGFLVWIGNMNAALMPFEAALKDKTFQQPSGEAVAQEFVKAAADALKASNQESASTVTTLIPAQESTPAQDVVVAEELVATPVQGTATEEATEEGEGVSEESVSTSTEEDSEEGE